MVFSSILFLFRFLPVFFAMYYMAPQRMRNGILFLGSLVFYAWGEPVYILLMLFSTVSDYLHGRWITAAIKAGKHRRAKAFLLSSIAVNLLLLGFFKYADFLTSSVNHLLGLHMPLLQLPLPIGISFYTFQTMSYTIDVYRGETPVQKNIVDFGTFVTMYPQLIAGPIVKYKTVAKDIGQRTHSAKDAAYGIKRFLAGLAKKVLFANQIGVLWNEISAMDFAGLPAAAAWMGIAAYALQIYFDFSGYSDMAIGLGAMMGFHFPENFQYPYVSESITEFWRRWHISLGSWFREYVYIPLGGSKRGVPRQLWNILIVWCLTGIWHGAGWNFLLWGLWFALLLMMEKLFLLKCLQKLPKAARCAYTLFAVLLGWVIFALDSLPAAAAYYKAMFGLNGAGMADRQTVYLFLNFALLFLLLGIAATPLLRLEKFLPKAKMPDTGAPAWILAAVETLFFLAIFLLSTAYLVDASYNPFLYFRF